METVISYTQDTAEQQTAGRLPGSCLLILYLTPSDIRRYIIRAG